jgi:hypothetical protein
MIALGVVPPAFGQAQPADSTLYPGAKIRVAASAREPGRLTGILLRVDQDSLHLETRNGTFAIPRSGITRIDVSRGQKSALGKGLKWGFLSGLAVGAVGFGILCGLVDGDGEDSYCYQDGTAVVLAASLGLGIVGGTGIGALIGAASHTERWERLSAPPSTSFYAGYGGRDRGALVGVRVAW